MRTLKHFSPSSLALWEKDPEEFFLKHLAETRAPRVPQEAPASVGSSFDAYAKSALHAAIYGDDHDPKYSFEALFDAQVEPQNRDFARPAGRHVYECYRYSGFFDELLKELEASIEPPRFEFEIEAIIGGVPFKGKPDCRYVRRGPVHVVHDWKVNGYCSYGATSPTKGYMICRDGQAIAKPNKSNGQAHKQYVPCDFHGFTIDTGYMEDIETDWADQLSLYGWALGEQIGDQNVVLQIHQAVAKPLPTPSATKDGPLAERPKPHLRFSQYRARVRDSYQHHLLKRLQKAWAAVSTGHVLHHLSREDNDARIKMLEQESVGLQTDGSTLENFFAEAVRPKYRG